MDATNPRLRPREPILNLPPVVTATLAVLVGLHLLRAFVLSDESDLRLLLALALVPARLTAALAPERADEILRAVAALGGSGDEAALRLAFARYILAEPETMPWTFLTYAGLHGSWAHVLLNGVWLAAFGTPVARRCGAWRYLALGALSTVAGGVLHYAIDPTGVSPLIGASAGVSGLMAAASRFIFQPRPMRPDGLPGPEAPWTPLQPLGRLLRHRPAVMFLGVWLVTNLLFGFVATPLLGGAEGGIAWDAHLGGFVAGFLLLPFLDRRPTI
jgi:membrane associated rhomboid family serine protease